MSDFNLAYSKMLGYEGPYDNDPKDPGGETVWGITRQFQPNWSGWERVASLKTMPNFPSSISNDQIIVDCVRQYYLGMWNELMLGDVSIQALAECIYNGCINQGRKRTLSWLQYCVNALTTVCDDVKEDGIMGVATINQISAISAKGNGDLLLYLFKAQRIAAYTVTVHQREDSQKYIKGWISRIERGG